MGICSCVLDSLVVFQMKLKSLAKSSYQNVQLDGAHWPILYIRSGRRGAVQTRCRNLVFAGSIVEALDVKGCKNTYANVEKIDTDIQVPLNCLVGFGRQCFEINRWFFRRDDLIRD